MEIYETENEQELTLLIDKIKSYYEGIFYDAANKFHKKHDFMIVMGNQEMMFLTHLTTATNLNKLSAQIDKKEKLTELHSNNMKSFFEYRKRNSEKAEHLQ